MLSQGLDEVEIVESEQKDELVLAVAIVLGFLQTLI